MPSAVPYKTSYYKKNWGFCLSFNDYQKFNSDFYNVDINTNFKNNINENLFFKKDIATFEYLLSTIFVKYNYSVSILNQSSLRYLRYLPFKFDYVIFYRNLIKGNLKELFFSIYYYFKRIKFMYKKLKLENFPIQL